MDKYISYEYLKDLLDYHIAHSNGAEHYAYNVFKKEISNIPQSAVLEVKHGHWISWGRKLKCSNCEHRVYLGTYDLGVHEEESKNRLYCSRCGARMLEELQ